jgi:hypothetical protein
VADLLTVPQLRGLIQSDLADEELQLILADEEARMIARLGPHGDGVTPVTAVVDAAGGDLFLPRAAVSVSSVAGVSSGYTAYPGQGRIAGGRWSGPVSVVYVPADDRAQRRRALVDLVRLTLQRTAMRAESVAGEHSYTAPDWEAERASIYRRLSFASI